MITQRLFFQITVGGVVAFLAAVGCAEKTAPSSSPPPVEAASASSSADATITDAPSAAGGTPFVPDKPLPECVPECDVGSVCVMGVCRRWRAPEPFILGQTRAGTNILRSSDGSTRLVAWDEDEDHDADSATALVSRVQAAIWSGGEWGAPSRLSNNTDDTVWSKAALSHDGRRAIVTWAQYEERNDGQHRRQVYTSMYSDETWSPPSQISAADDGTTGTQAPMVALSRDGSVALVGWLQEKDHDDNNDTPRTSERYVARWTATGWSAPVRLPAPTAHGRAAQFALSADGALAFAWWTGNGEQGVFPWYTSQWVGGSWSAAEAMSASGTEEVGAGRLIASADANTALALWSHVDGDVERLMQRVWRQQQWGPEELLFEGSSVGDVYASLNLSGTHSAFSFLGRTTAYGVHAGMGVSGNWSTTTLVSAPELTYIDGGPVALDPSGRTALVVWDANLAKDQRHVFAAFGVDGVWSAQVQVSTGSGADNQLYVSELSRSEDGSGAVAWTDSIALWYAEFR